MWRLVCVVVLAVAACDGGDDTSANPLTPEGHWQLALHLEDATPCPRFTTPTALRFTVRETEAGVLFETDQADVMVEDGTFVEDGVGTDRFLRVELTTRATWPGPEGSAFAEVDYELSAEANGDVIGQGTTFFFWDTPTSGTTCRYTFTATGRREAL
jgi:hypothetical protein